MSMRQPVIVALTIIVAGTVAISAMPAGAAGVAMLSESKGAVQVYQTGKGAWTRGTIMLLLYKGDRIKVGAKSQATVVYFKSGIREQLLSGSVGEVESEGFKVTEGPAKKSLGKIKSGYTSRLGSSRLTSGRSGGVLLRAGDEENQLFLESLGDTKTRLTPPVFQWSMVTGMDDYRVRVRNNDDQVVWESTIKTNSLTYPENGPSLQPGVEYSWQVEARGAGRPKMEATGAFTILPKEESQAVQKELEELGQASPEVADPTVLLLKATVLAEHDLWDEVIDCYLKLVEASPDDPAVHAKLAEILGQQGRIKASKEHADKAKALAKSESSPPATNAPR